MITSGGGFSQYYPQPFWQSTSTSGYLNSVRGTKNAPVAGYNKSGRGYPDVSLAGSKYLIIIGGSQYLVSGTSAAAPAVAGMVSLVNAARINAGRSALGWINPILYANHQMFTNDVTLGKNNCTAGPICCKEGFQAAIGWDPATGFGSINFMAFKDFFMDLGVLSPFLSTPTTRPTTAPRRPSSSSPTSRPTTATQRPSTSLPTSRPTIATPRPTPRPTARPTAQPTNKRTIAPTAAPSRKALLSGILPPATMSPTKIPTVRPQIQNPFGSTRGPPPSTLAPTFGIHKSKAKEPKRGPEPPLFGIFVPKKGGLKGKGPKEDDREGGGKGKGKGEGKGKGKGKGK